jgi:plasmid stabilization system protein ParE
MSLALRYREEVFCDIQEIRCHLNRYDSARGDQFANSVYKTLAWLAKNPLASRTRPEFRPEGLRSRSVFGFPSHLIFYVVADDYILIWRVLHGSRDLPGILTD